MYQLQSSFSVFQKLPVLALPVNQIRIFFIPEFSKKRCDNFYETKTTISPRKTTMGYGSRTYFVKNDGVPGSTKYTVLSEFDKIKNKQHMYTFGICREAYAKVYMETKLDKGRDAPGPGSYAIKKGIGSESAKFSLRPRTKSEPRGMKSPGPGAYNMVPAITEKGKQFFAKYKSSRAPKFSPPQSKRFTETRIFYIFIKK